MFNHEWLPILTRLTEQGIPCILITVMEAKGSTPREAGTKMIVTADKQFGTIGGGNLEFQATDEARKLLKEATAAPAVKDYPLGPKLAQCCGGTVSVLLEPFAAAAKNIYLFGAGHVGKEVVRVLDGLPLQVKWIDSRVHEFPADLPGNCEKMIAPAPADAFPADITGAFIVVMTHEHDLDYAIVRAALKKGGFAYLGLIGSDTKSVKFRKRLAAEGLDVSRLVCPIGIKSVKGKHPRAIAVSVAAEILSLEAAPLAAKEQNEEYVPSCAGCPNEAKCGT